MRFVRIGPGSGGPPALGCAGTGQGRSIGSGPSDPCVPDIEVFMCNLLPSFIVKGFETAFDIRLRNNGAGPSETFELTDILPAGWTPVSGEPSFSATDGNTATWIVDPIPAGGSAKFRIRALVGEECDIQATNTAQALEVPDDPDLTDNSYTFGPFNVRCDASTGI